MLPKLPGYAPTQDIEREDFHRCSAGHRDRAEMRKLAPLYASLVEEMCQKGKPAQKENGWETTTNAAFGSTLCEGFDPEVSEQRRRLLGAFREAVLTFSACFFDKAVWDGPGEARVRRVIIDYHLADDTISINEPLQPNSGILQGMMLKRQHILKPDNSALAASDFRVGEVLEILDIHYFICGCNAFTRQFFHKVGASQHLDVEVAPDEFERRMQNSLSEKKNFGLNSYMNNGRVPSQKKFFEEGLQVLRFFARAAQDRYIICYYPADDTIDVREFRCWPGQKQGYVMLLRRQKMAKNIDVGLPGIPATTAYINLTEFSPGASLCFLSRQFELVSCDLATQAYMREKRGVEFSFGDPESLSPKVEVCSKVNKAENASTAKQKNFFALMDEMKELRFGARLITPTPEDAVRHFFIIFYLGTGALCIKEQPIKNSGFTGGKFLERCVYLRPDKQPIEPVDLLVGKLVTINGHQFKVVNCDERTCRWLQTNFGFETQNIE